MKELQKITVSDLHNMAEYFLQNRFDIHRLISDFGEVASDNGYGTFFLKPLNPLFKVFWIYSKDEVVQSFGFGGPNLGLPLGELSAAYRHHTEGYSIYDSEYVYVFYYDENYWYTLTITSNIPLFTDGVIMTETPVNQLELRLIDKSFRNENSG